MSILLLFITLLIKFGQPYTISNYEIRDLEDQTSYFQTEALAWTSTSLLSSPATTQCTGVWLLGGYGVTGSGSVFTRTYSGLPTHSLINFSITFYLLDILGLESLLQIYFDSQAVGSWSAPTLTLLGLTDVCGSGITDYPSVTITGQVSHNSGNLAVNIISTVTGSSSFGFRDVNLLFSTSSGSTSACQFSLPLVGQDSCLCSAGQYGTSGLLTSCDSCAGNCQSCSGPSSSDCNACPDGSSYNGNSCFTCDSTCSQCNGAAANNCVSCVSGRFLYWNGTCLGECDAPLVVTTEGEKSFCNLPCADSSEFFFENNGTCGGDCPAPMVSRVVDVVKTCNLPCGVDEFLYPNGSCIEECNMPLISSNQGDLKYCNFPCESGEHYDYWNESCTLDCLAPYISSFNGDFLECWLPCGTNEFLYPNGSCIGSCDSPLNTFNYGDIDFCNFPCSTSGDYYYWNDTCHDDFVLPLISTFNGDILECSLPCPLTQYLYPNAECKITCDAPLIEIIQGDLQICDSPCSISQFLYWNGSCETSCSTAFQQNLGSSKTLCLKHCPPSEGYLYWNNSCESSCNTLFNQSVDSVTTERHCDWPCNDPSQVVLYQNGTCSQTCDSPYVMESISNDYYFCNSPCDSSEYYSLDKEKCISSCKYPSLIGQNGVLKTCKSSSETDPDAETTEESSTTLSTATSAIAKTAVGLAFISSFLRPGDPSGFTILALSKLLRYIEYIDVNYPDIVEELFEQDLLDAFSLSFNIGSKIAPYFKDEVPEHPSLHVFHKRGMESSFLVNLIDQIVIIAAALILSMAAILIERKVRKNGSSSESLVLIARKLRTIFKWNFFLLIFFSSFDDIVLCSSIELLTLRVTSYLDAVSLSTNIIMNLVGLYLLWKTVKITREFMKGSVHPVTASSGLSLHRRPSFDQTLFQKWEAYQVLCSGYRRHSFFTQGYVLFFVLRIIACYLIVSLFYEYPLFQACLLLVLSPLILFYLLKLKPMKEKMNLVETTVYEVIIAMVGICVLILTILDSLENDTESKTRENIGLVIVICNLAVVVASSVFSMVAIISSIIYAIKARKMSQGRGKAEWLNIFMAPYGESGMELATQRASVIMVKSPIQRTNTGSSILSTTPLKTQAQPVVIKVSEEGFESSDTDTGDSKLFTGTSPGENRRLRFSKFKPKIGKISMVASQEDVTSINLDPLETVTRLESEIVKRGSSKETLNNLGPVNSLLMIKKDGSMLVSEESKPTMIGTGQTLESLQEIISKEKDQERLLREKIFPSNESPPLFTRFVDSPLMNQGNKRGLVRARIIKRVKLKEQEFLFTNNSSKEN